MKRLPDPRGDRVVKSVLPPPAKPLSDELFYQDASRLPNWKALKYHLQQEGRVSSHHCVELIKAVSNLTSSEPNLLFLSSPITGDIHGQFYDFVKLLDISGDPATTQYVFLGDYVDRGSFSIEVLLLLYALKVSFPKRIWLLRGNHECRQMTAFFNFREECIYKYDISVYYAFMDSFDTLPLAAVVDNKFFCVHGGLSPNFDALNQIEAINRFHEPPRAGMFCDLLWADPIDEEKRDLRTIPSKSSVKKASIKFLQDNRLLSIIRAHEAQLEGFKMHQTNERSGFPTVITIFSAPNYCDCYNNKGAVLKFENNTLNIQQFNSSPHPYHLPNFMDVFAWSIPFVSEKVTEMLYAILTPTLEDSDSSVDDDDSSIDAIELPEAVRNFIHTLPLTKPGSEDDDSQDDGAETLRKKVQSVARLLRVLRTIRRQHELVVQLKGMTPGHRIPAGALLKGEQGLVAEIQRFTNAKRIDSINERRPS